VVKICLSLNNLALAPIPATIVAVKSPWPQHAFRYAACLAAAELVTQIYRHWLHVNPTTVALTFLLMVLWVAAYWGFRFSVFLAVLATLAFNYYFLPPIGTFTVADPQNWVALFAFLVTAGIASELADRARRQTADAVQRRRDVERLYSFSQRLLATDNVAELLNAIPAYVTDGFGAKAAAMYLLSSRQVYRTDPKASFFPLQDLQLVSSRGEPVIDAARGISLTPLHLGTRTTGAVGIAGPVLSRGTLEALGSMIGIAIERAGAIEKLSQAEAARQSETLRSVLLDSVTHELRTPLTGIKAAVTGLLSDYNLDEAQRKELLTVINEETDRLDRLVGEATEMAQLDAHKVELHFAPADMATVIDSAVADSRAILGQHPIEVHAPQVLPKVRVDSDRIAEVLKNLLENASKYSPPAAPITITAAQKGDRILTSVTDRGAGIDDFEQSLIFDKFYRGRDQRYAVQGTGMGLAIAKAIIEAHDGTISVTSQVGHGSVFSFELPAV
jgi:two-component system, OmpR family, sensor histidine kinase KdpD